MICQHHEVPAVQLCRHPGHRAAVDPGQAFVPLARLLSHQLEKPQPGDRRRKRIGNLRGSEWSGYVRSRGGCDDNGAIAVSCLKYL